MKLDELYEPQIVHILDPKSRAGKAATPKKPKTEKTELSRSEIARMGGIAARGKSGRPRKWTPEERAEQARVRVREWKLKKKVEQTE